MTQRPLRILIIDANAVRAAILEEGLRAASAEQGGGYGDLAVHHIRDDAKLLPRIAETFHQAEIGKTSPGLGIGLALVNSIVTLHGGRVRAESSGLGLGSRFIVELPLCEAPEARSRSTVSA